jgi:hypothetical protein
MSSEQKDKEKSGLEVKKLEKCLNDSFEMCTQLLETLEEPKEISKVMYAVSYLVNSAVKYLDHRDVRSRLDEITEAVEESGASDLAEKIESFVIDFNKAKSGRPSRAEGGKHKKPL